MDDTEQGERGCSSCFVDEETGCNILTCNLTFMSDDVDVNV